jgi:sugar/nucleoside kinase (ribokinase family)
MQKRGIKTERKVMVAGHLCLDITPKFPANERFCIKDVFSPGRLTNVEEATLSTGGAVSNTGLAMAKLGIDVVLNGKVGKDTFGRIIRQLVGDERTAGFKTVSGQSTSYTIVLAPPGIDRFVLHNPGTNDTFSADDIDYELLEECDLFHFGYPPLMRRMYENNGSELANIYRRVRDLGVTTSLDMAMPDPSSGSGRADWRIILEGLLPYVDIFMPSIEEIAFMLDRDLFETRKAQAKGEDPVSMYEARDCKNISDKTLSMGVKIVAIKCGIRGLYLRSGQAERICTMGSASPDEPGIWATREIWAGSFKTEEFGSTLGAGDASIGGFLCAFLRGYSPEDTLQIANMVGWQNVRAVDALSGIGSWQSTLELLREKTRPRNPVGLGADGWRYSKSRQVYYGPNDKLTLEGEVDAL